MPRPASPMTSKPPWPFPGDHRNCCRSLCVQCATGAMTPAEPGRRGRADADRGDQEAEDLLGDQHAAFVELVADPIRPPEHRHVDQQDDREDGDRYGEDADRLGSAEIVIRPTMPTGLSR